MFRYSVVVLLLVLNFCVTMHIYRPWIPEDVDWCLRVHGINLIYNFINK